MNITTRTTKTNVLNFATFKYSWHKFSALDRAAYKLFVYGIAYACPKRMTPLFVSANLCSDPAAQCNFTPWQLRPGGQLLCMVYRNF